MLEKYFEQFFSLK